MCTIGENFFFLGSRLADSLLVQHTLGSASGRTSSLMVKAEREEVIILLALACVSFLLEILRILTRMICLDSIAVQYSFSQALHGMGLHRIRCSII